MNIWFIIIKKFTQGSFLKVLGILAALTFNLLLAKNTNVDVYGKYSYFVSTIELIILLSSLGLYRLFLQENFQNFKSIHLLKSDFKILSSISSIVIGIPLCLFFEINPWFIIVVILSLIYKIDLEENRLRGNFLKLVFFQDLIQPTARLIILCIVLFLGLKLEIDYVEMIFLGAIVIAYLLSKKYYSFNKPKFINGLYERSKSINWKNAILILANLFLLKILRVYIY